jgi:basic amino acid/polyamine antiporter, APA family
MPLVFIAAYMYVAVSIFIDRPATALTALGVLAFFMVIYFARAAGKRTGATS